MSSFCKQWLRGNLDIKLLLFCANIRIQFLKEKKMPCFQYFPRYKVENKKYFAFSFPGTVAICIGLIFLSKLILLCLLCAQLTKKILYVGVNQDFAFSDVHCGEAWDGAAEHRRRCRARCSLQQSAADPTLHKTSHCSTYITADVITAGPDWTVPRFKVSLIQAGAQNLLQRKHRSRHFWKHRTEIYEKCRN